MRTMFYDMLRAAPVYPRRWAWLALFLITVAIGEAVFGWAAPVGLFAVAGLVAVARHCEGPWQAAGMILAVLLLLAGCMAVMVRWSPWMLALTGFAVWAMVTAGWLFREVAPTFTTKAAIERRGDRTQRVGSVASSWDIAERASRAAVLSQAYVLRPSLAGTPWRRIDPWAVASLAAQLDGAPGLRRVTRCTREVWTGCRDATLRVGGPGTGKTISLAEVARRAPGALLTCSTRLDLAMSVHADRRVYPEGHPQAGTPRAVHVFNPTGYGDVPSTVHWSILVDCTDYAAAVRRAGDLLPEARTFEGERWDEQGRLYFPVFLYAAAVGERDVQDVVRWIRDIGEDGTKDRAKQELINILGADPGNGEKIGLLLQLTAINSKTRSSITSTLTKALAWISDDTARRIGAAPLDRITLDVQWLILQQETLHIIGQDGGGLMKPLTSALIAEVAHQVRMLAALMPGERIDPPMTMALDEIAVSVELPLPDWSADMGGRGITLQLAVQSLAQLTDRWGKAGAATLLGNIGTLILFGGGKDADELARISELCGHRYREVVGGAGEDFDGDGKKWDRVPVLSPFDLSNLLPGEAAVLMRNLGGVVVARVPTVLDHGVEKLPLTETVEVPAPEVETDGIAALLPGFTGEAVA
jgi:type IV secretion system protein VirD4